MSFKYPLKAVIIDDELDAIEVLTGLINENSTNLEIVGTANSVQDGVALVNTAKPDVLFLDIQMYGETGFDVLKQTEYKDFHTIFVSAHESYAIEAIKFHAMAYLLKPVCVDELQQSIQLVKDEMLEQVKADYDDLLNNLNYSSDKRVAIPTGKGYRYFEPREIIRVEAAKNYSNVYTTDSSKPILVSRNLKQFELLLSKFGFLRIHHAHVVNLSHVREYIRQDGGYVLLTDKLTILVGKSYREALIQQLENFSEGI
jgi:two-component system LytT family response regulator